MSDDHPDPVMLEVMQSAYVSVAEEMGIALSRTAYSTNIKDRLDFSCALYDPAGALVAQAEHIPLHLGQMTSGVKNVIAELPDDGLSREHVYVVNDPSITGAHYPDLLMLKPVIVGGERVAIVANLAHHVDVGGHVPGSLYSGATEAYQEGVRIPVVQLAENGVVREDILKFFLANTRTERENRGDCLAQIAALNAGADKIRELVAMRGVETVRGYMAHVMDYAERRMRAAMAEVVIDGAEFADAIEGDGITADEFWIRARIESTQHGMAFDLTRSSDQAKGPINGTRPFALACVGFALKTVLDPMMPANEGMFRPIELRTRKGSIVDAAFPAPMSNNSSILGLRVVDAMFGALAECVPERVPAASAGTMNVFTVGGVDPRDGQNYAYIEAYGGGQGAFGDLDGMDGVQATTSNTRNAPAEAIEVYYPVRVERYGLVHQSGGRGRHRGGHGLERVLRFLGDADISIVSDRHARRPWGLGGGGPGQPAACELWDPEDGWQRLPTKCSRHVRAGSVLRLATAGGGGYGNPAERSEELGRSDRDNGLQPSADPE